MDEKYFTVLVDFTKAQIVQAIAMAEASNTSPHIVRVLSDFNDALGAARSEMNTILVGLTASRLNDFAEVLTKEGSLSTILEASLRSINGNAWAIANSIREWREFEQRFQSIEVDQEDVKASLGSSFKCNTRSLKGIGCCDGPRKQAPQQ